MHFLVQFGIILISNTIVHKVVPKNLGTKNSLVTIHSIDGSKSNRAVYNSGNSLRNIAERSPKM